MSPPILLFGEALMAIRDGTVAADIMDGVRLFTLVPRCCKARSRCRDRSNSNGIRCAFWPGLATASMASAALAVVQRKTILVCWR